MNKKWSLTALGLAALAFSVCAAGVSAAAGWTRSHAGEVMRVNAAEEKTTINAGTNAWKINAASTSFKDEKDNPWNCNVTGTTSFTQQPTYSQIGSGSKPAKSITIVGTLPEATTVSAISVKMGGFSGTAGKVSIKVGETEFASGALNAANDVTISATGKSVVGNSITISVTGIARGVKLYWIEYTTVSKSSSIQVEGVAVNGNGSINGNGATSVQGTYEYWVSYTGEVGNSGVNVSVSPSAFCSTPKDGQFTVTFPANGDYTITVTSTEDDTKYASFTTTVTGLKAKMFSKVTEMAAGQYLIIDSAGKNSLSNTISSGRAANGGVPQISESGTFVNDASATVWTISPVENYWTIQDGAGSYLAGTGVNNKAQLTNTLNDYAKWEISFDGQGVATVENVGNKAKPVNSFLKNNGDNGWATYASSTGTEPVFYRDVSNDTAISVSVSGETNLGVNGKATLTVSRVNDPSGDVAWEVAGEAVSISAETGDSIVVTAVKGGSATVTATLAGCKPVSIEFTVTKKLTGLEIVTLPTKTSYSDEEHFDPTGLVLRANYDDSTYKTLNESEYSYDKTGVLTVLDTAVTFTYEEGGVSKTAEVTISVTHKELVSIAVATSPNKSSYFVGETFDSTGLALTATYNDGTTGTILEGFTLDLEEGYSFTEEDLANGQKEVQVTYNEKSTTFVVDVVEPSGLIENGRYYIVNSAKTYGLNSVAATDSGPTQVSLTAANELMPFDFKAVAENAYEITIEIEQQKHYLTVGAKTNNGVRVMTSNSSSPWMVAQSEDVNGAFNFSSVYEEETRYLTTYMTQDWRSYTKIYETGTGLQDSNVFVVKEGSFAENIANMILDSVTCDKTGVTAPASEQWAAVKTEFNKALIGNEVRMLKNGSANQYSDNVIEKALAKYDFIVNKYAGFEDFLGRASASSGSFTSLSSNRSSIWTIAGISLAGLSTVGACLILHKKKEN
ncbi:MAG: bacterial Ig-like domain-containing protein [Candidatus Enteromonas sp.]|nr:bacterial Ig-like domain-containing protein [Candidatus Enteromonas sp.]